METYTPLYKLCDDILKALISNSNPLSSTSLSEKDLPRLLNEKDMTRLAPCCAFLHKEGYVDYAPYEMVTITPLGEFFINDDGYKAQLKKSKRRDRQIDVQYCFNWALIIFTFVLTVATVIPLFKSSEIHEQNIQAPIIQHIPIDTVKPKVESDTLYLHEKTFARKDSL